MDIYTLEELRKMNQLDGSKELVFLIQIKEDIERLKERIKVLEGYEGKSEQTLKELNANQYMTIDNQLKRIKLFEGKANQNQTRKR